MDKVKLILKRIISYALVLFGLSILIFVLVRVMPGDTARMALGARASEEAVEALRQEMHLNESYVVQYGYWISGMLSGDFGESVITKRPVIEDIKSNFISSISEYIVQAIKDGEVRYSKIASILSNTAGVADYKNLIVNGNNTNVQLMLNQIPTISETTIKFDVGLVDG